MAAYAAYTTNESTHLLTVQTNKRQEPHKRAYLLQMKFMGKTDQDNLWAKSRKG